MKILLLIPILGLLAFSQCTPKKDPAPDAVPTAASYRLSPRTQSVGVNGVVTYSASYTNTMGEVSNLVPDLVVVNSNIATVTEAGKVKGIAAGSTLLISSYRGLSDTVNLNVVADSNALASLYLSPDTAEVQINTPFSFNIQGRDLLGRTVTLPPYNLNAADPALGTFNTAGGLTYTGTAYGTTRLTATAAGVVSNPLEVAVIRKGSFRGAEGHYGNGTIVAKVRNGQVVIRFESDFLCQSAPDLRVYLSNSAETGAVFTNGIEIALLRSLQGRQSYVVPASVNINTYRHCVVYCRQFSQAVLTTPIN